MIIRDLSEESRALLELTKDGGLPDDAQLARTRARLAEKIGTGVVVGAAAATLGKTASAPVVTKAAGWSSSLALKALAALALLGGGAVGGYEYRAHESDIALLHAPTTAHALAAPAAPAPPKTYVLPSPEIAPPEVRTSNPASRTRAEVPAVHSATPQPVVPRARDTAPPPTQRVYVPPPHARPIATVSLMDDVTHLREAQRALAEGDLPRAREEAQRVRSDGPLAEEGEGMRILAACAEPARKAESQSLADGFAQQRPESPLLPRIRAACSPHSQ